jgi:hypothetical protein
MIPKAKKKVEKLTPKFWSPETYRHHHLASAKKFLEVDDFDDFDENENSEEQEKFLDAWEERENQTSAEKLLKRKIKKKIHFFLVFTNSFFKPFFKAKSILN